MSFEDYNGRGLQLRSCTDMQQPHKAHQWDHPRDGRAHCWGRNPLPADAVEKYTTDGCICEYCESIRKGIHPLHIMCTRRWEALPWQQRVEISESVNG